MKKLLSILFLIAFAGQVFAKNGATLPSTAYTEQLVPRTRSGPINTQWRTVGNGVADDTTGFQATLTAATNGIVHIPVGTNKITSGLTIPYDNMTIEGEGPGSVVVGDGGFEILFTVSGKTNVTFRNFKINGGCSIGIYMTQCTNSLITRMRVDNVNRAKGSIGETSPILLSQCDGVKVILNDGYSNGDGETDATMGTGSSGPWFHYNTTNQSINCVMEGNVFVGGRALYGMGGFDFSRCIIRGNYLDQGNWGQNGAAPHQGYAFLCYDSTHGGITNAPYRKWMQDNIVENNTFTNSFGTGMYFVVGKNNKAVGNRVFNVALGMDTVTLNVGGIVFNEQINSTADRNTVSGVGSAQVNAVSGIGIGASRNVVLDKNVILNVTASDGRGIFVNGSGEYFTTDEGHAIHDNYISNYTHYAVHTGTTGQHLNMKVRNNIVEGATNMVFFFYSMSRSIVEGNEVRGWPTGGYYAYHFDSGGTYPSQYNLIRHNVARSLSANSGKAFSNTDDYNTFLSNFVSSESGAVSIGYSDNKTTTIWANNNYSGSFTAPFTTTSPFLSYADGSPATSSRFDTAAIATVFHAYNLTAAGAANMGVSSASSSGGLAAYDTGYTALSYLADGVGVFGNSDAGQIFLSNPYGPVNHFSSTGFNFYGTNNSTVVFKIDPVTGNSAAGSTVDSTYRFALRNDKNSASSLLRLQNATAGGGSVFDIRSDSASGGHAAYSSTFATTILRDKIIDYLNSDATAWLVYAPFDTQTFQVLSGTSGTIGLTVSNLDTTVTGTLTANTAVAAPRFFFGKQYLGVSSNVTWNLALGDAYWNPGATNCRFALSNTNALTNYGVFPRLHIVSVPGTLITNVTDVIQFQTSWGTLLATNNWIGISSDGYLLAGWQDPSSIAETAFGFTDITTANATTSLHGLMPKLSNNGNKYFDGLGAQSYITNCWVIPFGDPSTAITTGTAKETFMFPYAVTIVGVYAQLSTASSSGIPTFDINEAGTTILSTKLTIDANETDSSTAATPPVISDSAIAAFATMTIDIDVAGTGAKGPKVYILWTR